jgi:predicted DNA-binding transcriptional regulator AlpA
MPPRSSADLLGLAEVAELLGFSRRHAARVTARPDFPRPVTRLAATPIWRKSQVEKWARDRERGRKR